MYWGLIFKLTVTENLKGLVRLEKMLLGRFTSVYFSLKYAWHILSFPSIQEVFIFFLWLSVCGRWDTCPIRGHTNHVNNIVASLFHLETQSIFILKVPSYPCSFSLKPSLFQCLSLFFSNFLHFHTHICSHPCKVNWKVWWILHN